MSRQLLESMATSDLIVLADEFGLDIPDSLNRRFIIGELLEADQEQRIARSDDDVKITSGIDIPQELPQSYNETKITAILRNPAWAFVFWDIREADAKRLQENGASLFLHVMPFISAEDEKPSDSFDIQIGFDDREQYVLMPAGKRSVVIQLAHTSEEQVPVVLASTASIEIPRECDLVLNMQPGKKIQTSEIHRLSGLEVLLRKHFVNHRQSFS